MAHVVPQAHQVLGQLGQAARWVWRTATETHLMLAQLPPDCSQAIFHAGAVCTPWGGVPRYFAAGFGPWHLGWGWFCIGVLTGLMLRQLLLLFIAAFQVRHSLGHHSRWRHSAQLPGRREEMLDLLIDGGPLALRNLATDLGEDPHVLLMEILRN